MRVRIVFRLKNKGAVLPFHHQYMMYTFLEGLLQDLQGAAKSLYTFSGLKGQTQVSRRGLHFFSNRVTWVFSSTHPAVIRLIAQKIFEKNQFEIGELQLIPEYIEKETFPGLSEETKFLCISPIILTNPLTNSFYAKHFVSPLQDLFSDLVYESTMTRMENSGIYTPAEILEFNKFQIVPDQSYISKIKESDKKFARIYELNEPKHKQEIRGYTFPFTLYAHPKVQQFVLQCGLGAFTHKGYGMLDLVDRSLTQRSVLYNIGELELF